MTGLPGLSPPLVPANLASWFSFLDFETRTFPKCFACDGLLRSHAWASGFSASVRPRDRWSNTDLGEIRPFL
jgi:hypothetical protein